MAALARIVELLEQIRDRLPDPAPRSRVTLFGYARGQEAPPLEAQVMLARGLLAGRGGDWSTGLLPVLAAELATEIVARDLERHLKDTLEQVNPPPTARNEA